MKKISLFLLCALCLQVAIGQSGEPKISPWNLESDTNLAGDATLFDRLSNEQITYRGGLIFQAQDRVKFGGLSALMVMEPGKSIVAISDYTWNEEIEEAEKAKWFQMGLSFGSGGELTGAQIEKSGQFMGLRNHLALDQIESVARWKDKVYLSRDGEFDIAPFDLKDFAELDTILVDPLEWLLLSPNFPNRKNGGIEAMTMADNGYLFCIYEKAKRRRNPYHEAWLLNPETNSTHSSKYYAGLENIKGATTLQNGDVLLIEKTFESPVTHLRLALIQKGDLGFDEIRAKTVLECSSSALDNFEGITSYVVNGKEYILLISDDNGEWEVKGQRTILMQFELNFNTNKK